jgi:hypothetical protein
MKKEHIVYSIFIIATVVVAFVLTQTLKDSDQKLLELALNDSDVSFCSRINPKSMLKEDSSTQVKIQGMTVLKDLCFSELAEPINEKVNYCENVSDQMIVVCEEPDKCYQMSAKEACYREMFKDYVSNTMPPQEGAITDMALCEDLSMFRDNCLYLYAITTGDTSACDRFDNQCDLRKQLCVDEAKKAQVQPLDFGDAVVYGG